METSGVLETGEGWGMRVVLSEEVCLVPEGDGVGRGILELRRPFRGCSLSLSLLLDCSADNEAVPLDFVGDEIRPTFGFTGLNGFRNDNEL